MMCYNEHMDFNISESLLKDIDHEEYVCVVTVPSKDMLICCNVGEEEEDSLAIFENPLDFENYIHEYNLHEYNVHAMTFTNALKIANEYCDGKYRIIFRKINTSEIA